jgi:glycosidase
MRIRLPLACLCFLALVAACGPASVPAPIPAPIQPITSPPQGTDGFPWWNDTVFCEIFVRSFQDSNGDGIGDFNGIISRLDYLNDGDPSTATDLGVTGLWLMPIHPSPSYHGYDVTDYYAINPEYGTLEDFQRLLDEAHRRGMRVIIDLVLNHTSSQHPWFIEAQDPASPYRDWYIWSDTDPGYTGPWGQQTWHPSNSGFYYGLFWAGMPDLNYTKPQTSDEMLAVTRFWLEDVGVDGFRLDAAPHLIEMNANQQNSQATHEWYEAFRPIYKSSNPQALTVGEIWDQSGIIAGYTQGDELDLAFEFHLAEAILVSSRTGDSRAVREAMNAVTRLYPPGQFATFLTNHDQNRVVSQLFASPEKARTAVAMLLTLPGVPFIYYGEEIGMTGIKPDEQLRTPMQWTEEASAGFTSSSPWIELNPDYKQVNAASQEADPDSLLTLYRRLVYLRNQHAALRVGEYIPVQSDNPALFAFLRISEQERLLVIVNLGEARANRYELSLPAGVLADDWRVVPLIGADKARGLAGQAAAGNEPYRPAEAIKAYDVVILQFQK